jgi:hypothetical protein
MARPKGIKQERHNYTQEEIDFLKENYPVYSAKELTEVFNKQFNTNLKDTTLKSTLQRLKISSGRTGQFEKGKPSFNKGLKWDDFMSKEAQENSRKTCFTKDKIINNSNHNEVPVGTEVIGKDGYIFVKVDKKAGSKARRWWKYKHHLVWEKHYGKIPKEKRIIFADNNKYNFNIDNLILVDKGEIAQLNRRRLICKGLGIGTKCNLTMLRLEERIRRYGKE